MSLRLQISLFSISIIVFLVLLNNIRRSKISTDMATVWILWGIGLIVLSLFPQIVTFLGKIVGIVTPVNTLYLIMIFLLYVLVFFLYIKVSVLEEKIKNLIHAVALDEKEHQNEKNSQ